MSDILPCPFCGQAPHDYPIEAHEHAFAALGIPGHPGSHWIECGACDFHMGRESREAVVAAWNRRAP